MNTEAELKKLNEKYDRLKNQYEIYLFKSKEKYNNL